MASIRRKFDYELCKNESVGFSLSAEKREMNNLGLVGVDRKSNHEHYRAHEPTCQQMRGNYEIIGNCEI